MALDLADPDLAVPLRLEPVAARAARHSVGNVDSPSPDLRDLVKLLTSELVTRIVGQRGSHGAEMIALRVWMPEDVVRVELEGHPDLFRSLLAEEWPAYDLMLLDQLADRWSVETDEHHGCVWLEIDRR
jgi:hypothetical protein